MTHQTQIQNPAQASSKAMFASQNNQGKTAGISRTEYRKARRLIRDNGRYALRWMPAEVFAVMDVLETMKGSTDQLTERAAIVAHCKREGIQCNARQTA